MARAGFVVKQLENACGALPGGDKAMAPGLCLDRTASFLSPSHFPAETEGLTDELPWTI